MKGACCCRGGGNGKGWRMRGKRRRGVWGEGQKGGRGKPGDRETDRQRELRHCLSVSMNSRATATTATLTAAITAAVRSHVAFQVGTPPRFLAPRPRPPPPRFFSSCFFCSGFVSSLPAGGTEVQGMQGMQGMQVQVADPTAQQASVESAPSFSPFPPSSLPPSLPLIRSRLFPPLPLFTIENAVYGCRIDRRMYVCVCVCVCSCVCGCVCVCVRARTHPHRCTYVSVCLSASPPSHPPTRITTRTSSTFMAWIQRYYQSRP